jgi:TetR/AcrR family transcriptional regulator
MGNQKDKNTEKRILESARHIFHTKGFAGTRMQIIADEASINKAMLHYYFRSKDKLFEAVFNEALEGFFPKILKLIDNDLPLFDKIDKFIHSYINILLENPHIPGFIITEINQNPKRLRNYFSKNHIEPPKSFANQVLKAIADKIIIPIDPKQLMLNTVSLCLFPIIARPVIETVFKIPENRYISFMEKRKEEVSIFIINSIKVK